MERGSAVMNRQAAEHPIKQVDEGLQIFLTELFAHEAQTSCVELVAFRIMLS